jgi:hypothetical protein
MYIIFVEVSRNRKSNAVIMVTENLLQNILEAKTSAKRPKRKEEENYRPYSGAVGV